MTNKSVKQLRLQSQKCINLLEQKSKKYGDSWRIAKLSTLIDMVLVKYGRLQKLVENPKENVNKIKSDLQDAANYSFMALQKLEEENNKK